MGLHSEIELHCQFVEPELARCQPMRPRWSWYLRISWTDRRTGIHTVSEPCAGRESVRGFRDFQDSTRYILGQSVQRPVFSSSSKSSPFCVCFGFSYTLIGGLPLNEYGDLSSKIRGYSSPYTLTALNCLCASASLCYKKGECKRVTEIPLLLTRSAPARDRY